MARPSRMRIAGARAALARAGARGGVAATLVAAALIATLAQNAQASPDRDATPAPLAEGVQAGQLARGRSYMAVTANPHASRAAAAVLRRGGSAADAAIAAQLVLGLTEPQSSGIGGGAFALYWERSTARLHAYDGRETAPADVDSRLFTSADGSEMPFWERAIGGLAVGVPGVPALLERLHQRHGRLRWASLHWPAIALAERGFAVSERLHSMLSRLPRLEDHPGMRGGLLDRDGAPRPVGYVLRNPAYARTLHALATGGPDVFYRGALARDIVAAVRADPVRPGTISAEDMAAYRVVEREPLCAKRAGRRVCGMPPPSSGGATTLAILGMLERFDADGPPLGAERVHRFAEASKLAFADRNATLADPDFVPQPVDAMLAPAYLARRALLIRPNKAGPTATSGVPTPHQAAPSPERPSTSHMAIVDRYGNVLSMTTSIEAPFGSRATVGGFLLNNQLTDFSFAPPGEPQPANAPGPRKRPRSSMSPTIAFGADGAPELAIGSPGGSRIIGYVAQALRYHLVDGMPLDEVFLAARIAHVNAGTLELERGHFDADTIRRLESFGHRVEERRLTSGLHAVRLREGVLSGYADPRREGLAIGE